MAVQIEIAAIPNQKFSVVAGGSRYELTLKACDGIMAATVVRDDVTVVDGQRLVAGQPALPYRYQEAGNFVLLTADDALPDWEQFGLTQFLYYLTADELSEARGNG